MFGIPSREERQFNNNLKLRGALRDLDRREREAGEHINKFVDLARRARDYGDTAAYNLAFKSIDQSLKFQKVILRQRLLIESGKLALDQGQSMASFERAMTTCSNALGAIHRSLNFPRMAARSQRASRQAQMMQERMDLTMDEMLSGIGDQGEFANRPEEIESLIVGAERASSSGQLQDLQELRNSITDMRDSIRRSE